MTRFRTARRGFTLVELLVVIGLMAMLATLSIGGYNAAVRGMDERAAREDTISLVRSAMQRALMDNVPTAVFCYNQLLRAENDDEAAIVVGCAVAVRMGGRISYTDGDFFADEFADWRNTYPEPEKKLSDDPGMRLYRMTLPRSDTDFKECFMRVKSYAEKKTGPSDEMLAAGYTTNNVAFYGFTKAQGDESGITWRIGDPYGFEIGSLQLQHGFIFGKDEPKKDETPTSVKVFFFNPATLDAGDYKFPLSGGLQISAYRLGKGGQMRVEQLKTITATDFNQ